MCEGPAGGPSCKPIINHRKVGGVKTLHAAASIYLSMNVIDKLKIIILLPLSPRKYLTTTSYNTLQY